MDFPLLAISLYAYAPIRICAACLRALLRQVECFSSGNRPKPRNTPQFLQFLSVVRVHSDEFSSLWGLDIVTKVCGWWVVDSHYSDMYEPEMIRRKGNLISSVTMH